MTSCLAFGDHSSKSGQDGFWNLKTYKLSKVNWKVDLMMILMESDWYDDSCATRLFQEDGGAKL